MTRRRAAFLYIVLLTAALPALPAQTITTVAGNGTAGFSGDGGPATSAAINQPGDIVIDSAGNLYIADATNNRIRKVTAGIITTFAGSGTRGFSGDGGAATSAALSGPGGVGVDSAGNVYIADFNNNRVRKVSTTGIISTVAGNGTAGSSGDGGPATSATLNGPSNVAVDSAGNFYISEFGGNRIRKVTAAGVISTVAGNGTKGFSGDGGSATSAMLSTPTYVQVDAVGNLFIADYGNNRIRVVTRGGGILTMAGNGTSGFSGDGGPATSAQLRNPSGVAIDFAGNFYIADLGNARVRKVSTAGIISTFAGNGTSGFSGDGGPATSAQVSPAAVALDPEGNLNIVDLAANRIRKVTLSFSLPPACINGLQVDLSEQFAVITGGPGAAPASISWNFGDGVSTTSVPSSGLWPPQAHTYSVAGQYTIQATVHYIDGSTALATQNVTVGAGLLSGCFPLAISAGAGGSVQYQSKVGSGTVAAGSTATLQIVGGDSLTLTANSASGYVFGNWSASSSVTATDGSPISTTSPLLTALAYGASTINASFVVVVTTPTLSSLSFNAVQGTNPAGQQFQVTSNDSSFDALVTTTSGGAWLSVSPATGFFGSAPVTFSASVNSANLAPGTYSGKIRISTLSLPVTLTVTAAPAAQLTVSPASLSAQTLTGVANSIVQSISIGDTGSTTLNWTATASTVNGGNWLSVSPAAGSASLDSPAVAQVSFNVQFMAAGVYSGTITVNPGGLVVTVRLLISPSFAAMTLGQTGLLFTGVAGGAAPPPQSVIVANTAGGAMSWTDAVQRGTGISTGASGGTSTAGAATLPSFAVQASTSGLAAGSYYGLIQVAAPGAANAPQFVSTVLNVLPSGSTVPLRVYPQGLIFTAAVGGTPPPQTLTVSSTSFTEQYLTQSGGSWLSVTGTGPLTVTAKTGSLSAGVYQGTLTILPYDGSPSQDVNISLVVTAGLASAPDAFRGAAIACSPTKLLMAMRQLGNNFSSPVGWPVNLEAQVLDDCGNPALAATVIATFSNGDPPLALPGLGNGIFSATWKPANMNTTTVTVQATAAPLLSGSLTFTGQIGANSAPPPAIGSGGVVNAASFASGADLAPGSIVSVFGTNLASSNGNLAGFPLPTTLANLKLTIGGIDAPLFYAGTGQVNAQLPFELTPGTLSQVVARAIPTSGAESDAIPEPIVVGAAHPGIFIATGTQGAILNASNQVVNSANPATAGDVIVIFCTGLGAVSPAVITGQAPNSGLVVTPTAVTVGGQTAVLQYAGVAPGFVGLYQVNAVVPSGVAPGGAVSVVITQNGVASNVATIAVH